MKKYKIEISIAIVLLIMGVISVKIYREHGDIRLFSLEDLFVSGNLVYSVSEDILSIESLPEGVDFGILESPGMYLERGNYIFAVGYNTDSQSNVVQLVSDTSMDAEGNIGVVYAESVLNPQQERVRLEVEFEQDVSDLHIRLLVADESLRINEMVYRNSQNYRDPIIFYLLYTILIVYLYLVYRLQKKKANSRLFDVNCLVFFCAFLTTLPLMNDYLTWGHDIAFHLARIEGIARAMKYGQFPVRINPVQASGYGNASSVMYPQLFLYLPAILRLCGLSLMNCYKVLVFTINLLTAICAYLGFTGVWKDRYIGAAGCVIYMMGLYRMDNIYIRASLGEALAMAFLPLIFWGMYELLFGDYRKWPVAAIGFSFVLQSHILSAGISCLITLVVFAVCFFFIHEKMRRIIATCIAAGITLLCNLWFILPFLQYLGEGFAVFDQDVYVPDRTAYLSQVFGNFQVSLGFVLPLGSTQGEMPLTVGLSSVLGIFFLIYVLRNYRAEIEKDVNLNNLREMGIYTATIAGILLFCSLWIIPWEVFGKVDILLRAAKTMQYMWRLLGPALFFFCCATLAGVKIWFQLNPKLKGKMLFIIILLAIILGWPSIDATMEARTYPAKEYVANSNYTDILYYYESSDAGKAKERGNKISFREETGMHCLNMLKEGSSLSADLMADVDMESNYVEIPFYYYPGYRVFLDDVELRAERGEHSVLKAKLPNLESGKLYHLRAFFAEPTIWKISDWISVFSLIGCICWFTICRRRN